MSALSSPRHAGAMRHTVVIPLHDKRDYIAETLASLAGQTQPPDQLVLVDDASTDDSLAIARDALATHARALRDCTIEVLALPRNVGPGGARNAGLARARGEIVSFLDADDRYRPDALRTIGERMRTYDLALAVLGYDSDPQGERFPEPGTLDTELHPLADDTHLLPMPLRTAGHPAFLMGRASNVAVRRRWLDGLGYHTEARLNEGIDFWYRVLRAIVAHGGQVGLIGTPLIRFRIVADSLSHRPPADWRAIPPPPSVLRYVDSDDADDRRLAAMLAARWRDYALAVLADPAQRRAFLEHHRDLLARVDTDALASPA